MMPTNNSKMMDPLTARQILEEVTSRYGDLSALQEHKQIDFKRDLFDKQRLFIESPSKKKAALCGRRSGKTVCCAYYLVKTAYEKKCDVVYVGLSRGSAKSLMWLELQNILGRYKIAYESNLQSLQFTLANGSRIFLGGASTEREIEKYRGMHYELVIIDECGAIQFMPLLDNFIKNVLGPTLIDTGGTICLISSPGPICSGLFFRITEKVETGWDVHKWTVRDNPKLPRWHKKKNWKDMADELFEEIKEEHGWDDDSPVFRREYKGEWVKDNISLVYKFEWDRNTYTQLPSDIKEWHYLIGIDFGVADSSAIIVGAYSFDSEVLYIVDAWKNNDLSPGEAASIAKEYYDKYKPVDVEADSQGIGLAFIKEIQNRFGLPVNKAEKFEKVPHIELMNDEFKKGRIKIQVHLKDLLEEITKLQWKDIQQKILPDFAEDHCCDAALYMWRRSMHYMGQKPKRKPKVGSEEWQEELWSKDIEAMKRDEEEAWWESL